MTDKNINLTVKQDSGMASNGSQEQAINVGSHYHGDVYKKLVALHGSSLTFDPSSLRDVITTIDEGISTIDDDPIDYSLGIDIEHKNELNNHSKDYFEEFVELDFYPHFQKLDNFFALKENQKLQSKIDRVIKSLNRQVLAFQGEEKFEQVLLNICSKLVDQNYDFLKEKEEEILLILYYFYCNCCLGKKTKEEKSVGSQ